MRYLQHGNWRVREGAIFLLAHCVFSQLGGKKEGNEQEIALSLNQNLITEIIQINRIEDKQKIQQLIIDIFALMIDRSPD